MNFKENTVILGCLNANYRDEGQGETQNQQIKKKWKSSQNQIYHTESSLVFDTSSPHSPLWPQKAATCHYPDPSHPISYPQLPVKYVILPSTYFTLKLQYAQTISATLTEQNIDNTNQPVTKILINIKRNTCSLET